MFSKACEYGIRAVIYIWSQSNSGKKLGIKDICKEIDAPSFLPPRFCNPWPNRDNQFGQGTQWGFYVEGEQEHLTLIDLVIAIDGDQLFKGCGLGLKQCSEETPCPIHNDFKVIRDRLEQMLRNKKIVDLASEINSGAAILSRLTV